MTGFVLDFISRIFSLIKSTKRAKNAVMFLSAFNVQMGPHALSVKRAFILTQLQNNACHAIFPALSALLHQQTARTALQASFTSLILLLHVNNAIKV
jgi:hypothetical protein